jgi:fluoride ion exporter CrcB/FEX
MIEVLAIALGAAIGAPSRFILDRWVVGHAPTKRFPWSLLVVNVLGSAIAGVVFALTTGNLWRTYDLLGLWLGDASALVALALALYFRDRAHRHDGLVHCRF